MISILIKKSFETMWVVNRFCFVQSWILILLCFTVFNACGGTKIQTLIVWKQYISTNKTWEFCTFYSVLFEQSYSLRIRKKVSLLPQSKVFSTHVCSKCPISEATEPYVFFINLLCNLFICDDESVDDVIGLR